MVPSVLWELVEPGGVFNASDLAARYALAYSAYRSWCKTNDIKDIIGRKFTQKVWGNGKYPQLSQVAAKASSLRCMVYWLHSVCRTLTATAHDNLRACMVAAWVDFDSQCRQYGRWLTDAQSEAIALAVERALVCYNALARSALTQRKFIYKTVPKFHAIEHIAFDWSINPRFTHCYQDEDMVGRLKLIFNGVHAGCSGKRVKQKGKGPSGRALWRYSLLVCMRWWNQMRVLRGIPSFHHLRCGKKVLRDDTKKLNMYVKEVKRNMRHAKRSKLVC